MGSSQKQITEAIKEARPRLSAISPLVAKIVIGFAGVNILLGIGLATTQSKLASPLVVAPTGVFVQIWGVAFFILGLAMAYGYWRNNWYFIRKTFIIGMVFKLSWFAALVIRYFGSDYNNPTLLVVWLFFAYIQMVTFIHFMPTAYVQKAAEDAE